MCNGFRILSSVLGVLAVVMPFSLKSISAAAEDPFSGPYIGLQAAQSHLAIGYDYRALSSFHEYGDLNASGYEGGVYLGYGRTIKNFYLGLQGDYLIGTAASDSGDRPHFSERRFGEAASYGIAGRMGYNVNDTALPYILFGWQHIDIDVTQDYPGTAFDQRSSVGLDGMRFGAGMEFPLLPHVLARMEYGQTIYPDLLVSYPLLGSAERNKVIGGTGRVGIAYNFGGPSSGGIGKTSPALTSGTADPFDGFYLGLEGGAEMANLHFQYIDPITPFSTYSDPGAKGFTGGIFAGYGKTFGNIYAGAQAGFTVSTTTQNDGRLSSDYERRLGIGPYGGVTGRLGYVMANTVMPYLIAGWRRANFTLAQDYGGDETDRRITTMRDGWVIGLGTEVMVAKNISLRLEYDQATYQSIRVPYPAFNSYDQIDPVTNTGRIGVAYRF